MARQKAGGKRFLAILHFVTYLGFFVPTYLWQNIKRLNIALVKMVKFRI
jgi:hypothetical protein